MKYTMNDITKVGCNKAAKVAFNINEGTNFRYERAVACKKALHEQIFNKAAADIDADLEEAFENVETRSNKQKEVQKAEMKKYIERYVHSETRPLIKATPNTVVIPLVKDVEVSVSPDFLVITDMTDVDKKDNPEGLSSVVEVIKIKMGKPDITQKAAQTNVGFHALSVYGRAFVGKGEKAKIIASQYYLRRKDDRGGSNPHFEENFFAKGGLNVVSVSDIYTEGDAETELDKTMLPKWEEFLAGKEETDCTEDDCKYCKYHDACKYQEPPVQSNIVKKLTKLSSLVLSEEQQDAVNYTDGILRINAGAGAGKTTVVALRVVNLLLAGVAPESIILLTFTVPGAEEMRTRINDYINDFGLDEDEDMDLSKMRIMTFNAFGNEVIKEEFGRFGFAKVPKVIDAPERASIIADLLNSHDIKGLDYKNFSMATKSCMGALGFTQKAFDIIKREQLGCGDEDVLKDKLGYLANFAGDVSTLPDLISLYDEYDEMMRDENLIEFADQEVMLMELLHEEPYYLEKFGFEHIIVDEFQDSNENQIHFLQLLAECPTFKSLMVVGDENQAIYGFRGCSPEFIINFDTYFAGRKVDDIDILENRRSTKKIIEFANKIAGFNYSKRIHELISTREDGNPVIVRGFISKNAEYEYIVESIEKKIKAGTPESSIAVICPKNEQLNQISTMLKEKGITTVMLNPEPLLENSRVLAVLNFFKFWQDDTNERAAFSFINAAMMGGAMDLSQEEVDKEIEDLKKQILKLRRMPLEARIEALEDIFKSIDYNDDELYQSFVEGLLMKGEKMPEYAADFLEFGENEKRRRNHAYDGVALTTAHSSKGLEWSIVYNSLTGYDSEDLHVGKNSRDKIEEKNRLLFVSCTRARDELIVTGDYTAYGNAKTGYVYNQFLKNLYDVVGQKFDATTIEGERLAEKERARIQKEEEKAAKAAKEDK